MGHPEWFLSSKNGKINCIIIFGVRVRVDTDLTHLCYQPWRNKTLSWYLLDRKPFSLKYLFCGTPFWYEIILGTFLSKHLDHVLTRFLANSWLGHLQVKHTCNLIITKKSGLILQIVFVGHIKFQALNYIKCRKFKV